MQEFMKILDIKSGTTTTTYTFTRVMNGVDIINESTTTALTLTVNGMSFSIPASSGFADIFENFQSLTVTITGTASHKLVVRGF